MQHSNGVSITDSKRLPRAASADARVPQADGCAESSRLRYAGLARSLDVNGEQRCRPLGARPARLPVDGVRLIARRRDSRVCAHEPPRPAATPLKVPATVACGGSAEQGVDGNRAKRNPGPIPANPYMGTGSPPIRGRSGAIASRASSHSQTRQPRHRTIQRTAPRLHPTTTTWNLSGTPRPRQRATWHPKRPQAASICAAVTSRCTWPNASTCAPRPTSRCRRNRTRRIAGDAGTA